MCDIGPLTNTAAFIFACNKPHNSRRLFIVPLHGAIVTYRISSAAGNVYFVARKRRKWVVQAKYLWWR